MGREELLPDFFILGAAKCGTTSLHHYLRQHPDLYLPYVKELGYFKTPEEHFRTHLDEYLTHFEGTSASLKGEATPGYFREVETVAPRIRKLYADRSLPKFILAFRNPIERAFSHYLHKARGGSEGCSFEEALRAEQAKPQESWKNWASYFRDGVYADPIEQWFEQFPKERFHVLLTGDLAHDAEGSVERIFGFLGVSTDISIQTDRKKNAAGPLRSTGVKRLIVQPPEWFRTLVKWVLPNRKWRRRIRYFVRRLNTGEYKDSPRLDDSQKAALRERYRPHIHRLETIIDRDLSAWYES